MCGLGSRFPARMGSVDRRGGGVCDPPVGRQADVGQRGGGETEEAVAECGTAERAAGNLWCVGGICCVCAPVQNVARLNQPLLLHEVGEENAVARLCPPMRCPAPERGVGNASPPPRLARALVRRRGCPGSRAAGAPGLRPRVAQRPELPEVDVCEGLAASLAPAFGAGRVPVCHGRFRPPGGALSAGPGASAPTGQSRRGAKIVDAGQN